MPCVSAAEPLLLVGAGTGGVEGDLESESGVMVDWEEEREKVLARGARWVSLSSVVTISGQWTQYREISPFRAYFWSISTTY
jgi:hypothetical protein